MPNVFYLLKESAPTAMGNAACSALDSVDPLPQIPTMAATALQLELLLQDTSVDLKAISEVILSDAGATLQILRLVGEEFPEEDDRPTRIEDCIASLNSEFWYEAICASGLSRSGPLMAEWQQCRRIAQLARELARCLEGFSPDEAYVVGLLHRLGRFPHLLGWDATGDNSREHRALGVMLADFWHLPNYLVSAMQEEQEPAAAAKWTELLNMAHQLAEPA
jgi:HD-like signal output (HDOD) protein